MFLIYNKPMIYALLVLNIILIVFAVCILLKVFKPAEKDNHLDEEVKAISKDQTVVLTKLEDLDKRNIFLYETVERKLQEIRQDNEKQLGKIQETVNEKLQTTLENRLSTSFKTVSEQLARVYDQLGQIQNLTKDVGNLEKVLTNVKTRGMWGELQAERILQEILTPEQYLKNVPTKHLSKDPVEFAVKLPGADREHQVLLPIDSKFPREDYERLCDATQNGDFEAVKLLRNALERRVKDEAKDICEKYIDVPFTTDFAVMFLPIEGLYAEILALPGLQEKLQHEYHVMVAGPATLASLLNSLQMGFRTLAIERKSAEVWHVLGQVKTEFGKFESTMLKVQEKLSSASKEVENVFTRQRQMARKLKNVEAVDLLPSEAVLLEESDSEDILI